MPPGNRPKEVHTKHLTELERFRVRTLYFDAGMSKKQIEDVTGYSNSQIRTAIRAKSAAIPHRTGRPRKQRHNQEAVGAGPSQQSQGSAEGDSSMALSAAPDSSSFSSPSELLAANTTAAQALQVSSSSSFPPTTTTTFSPFSRLPPHLRRYIWALVLAYPVPGTASAPLSMTWWVEPLPRAPWLAAGVFPEPPQQQHPHPHPHPQQQQYPHQQHWTLATHHRWRAYVAYRHAPARVLCAVSREARRLVADTFAAVWSAEVAGPGGGGGRVPSLGYGGLVAVEGGAVGAAGRGGGCVPFLWIDPRRDDIYCEDPVAARDVPALLERSRAALLPHLVSPPPGAPIPLAGGFVGGGGAARG
ncbi:hypothetical protein GGR52DRAFT_585189 [Hypoxylon sp. FL1284]|nr:hypothetical protein GGR52DRAFT_585189 [Hypoxylon sp. FL1284]